MRIEDITKWILECFLCDPAPCQMDSNPGSENSEDYSNVSYDGMNYLLSPEFNGNIYNICINESLAYTPFCQQNNYFKTFQNEDIEEILQNNSLVRIIVPILFGIVVIVGLFGNALVVIVVAANQQMRNTTNLLIINLAIADLLFIVFCVPFTACYYALPSWPFGDTWCKIVQYLIIVTAYISVYTLVLMSLDRYLAVVHPISSMSIRTESNTYIAIIAVWSILILVCIPVALVHGELVFYIWEGVEKKQCHFLTYYGSLPTFQIAFFVTAYVLPLSIIIGLYFRMISRLWKGVKNGGKISAEGLRGKKRVTRMVVIVVIIFAVCWCPVQILLILISLDVYDPTTGAGLWLLIPAQTLAYMNSCVNPILYAFLSDNFRKAFRKVIHCGPFFYHSSEMRLQERSEGKQMAKSPMLPHPQNPTMTTNANDATTGEKSKVLGPDVAEAVL
ncbi:allatostatin-A receptor-like [Artemia franciscana]|uniref:G-protein coupled receptors family 1 profile domain-containing protein n=1 Tax=Artemia franciscana TaxID=6661 RepID=A0AA88KYB2_ARTSF|nr:hypothetical protein QYM36_012983 [Artemia franciscana]